MQPLLAAHFLEGLRVEIFGCFDFLLWDITSREYFPITAVRMHSYF